VARVRLPTQFLTMTSAWLRGGFSIEQESIFQCDVTCTDVTKPIVNILTSGSVNPINGYCAFHLRLLILKA